MTKKKIVEEAATLLPALPGCHRLITALVYRCTDVQMAGSTPCTSHFCTRREISLEPESRTVRPLTRRPALIAARKGKKAMKSLCVSA
ncbi:hypothetical protein XENTR_v10019042 [Xenopus tropicalis]|nr:hypothetical protein XENTR_v10019042 [Xenopus tropicalis]